MWRFSAKRAYRYPVLRTSAVASTPHGTCETCRQSTTPRPLSAAARCSELEGERLRCPCWARAQFTRHLIARCCKTAEAVASVDPPQAPTGARSALRELPAPTAVLAMRPAAASAARTVTSGSLARAAVDEVITGAAWTRSRPESQPFGGGGSLGRGIQPTSRLLASARPYLGRGSAGTAREPTWHRAPLAGKRARSRGHSRLTVDPSAAATRRDTSDCAVRSDR
jgi:hypothetical protein